MTSNKGHQRPDLIIKVFPNDYVAQKNARVLQELKKTNALILGLKEPSGWFPMFIK